MADEYLHGVRVLEINEGTRPIKSIATGVIGTVCTADDADAEFFPLDTPVLITNPQSAIAKAGKTGTLSKTLNSIANQTRTPCVIVRVKNSQDADELTANIIGTVTEEGQYTGMKALLVAKTKVGFKPRILGVPEHDNLEVAVALASIAVKLRAFAYVSAYNCKNKEEAIAYQKNFSQREVMVIYADFLAFNVNTKKTETESAVACALGLRAKIDKEIGWHKTISNIAINGVSGVSKDITFDIQDSSTDANLLNEKHVTVPINYNGFRLWGSRTCTDDPLFNFENYTRTAQIVADTFGEAFDWAIDKPMSPMLVKDMLEMINQRLRYWVTAGYLVGGKAWLDPEFNVKDVIKDGKLNISYDYTPVPPLENLNLRQHITDEYLMDFAAKVAAA